MPRSPPRKSKRKSSRKSSAIKRAAQRLAKGSKGVAKKAVRQLKKLGTREPTSETYRLDDPRLWYFRPPTSATPTRPETDSERRQRQRREREMEETRGSAMSAEMAAKVDEWMREWKR